MVQRYKNNQKFIREDGIIDPITSYSISKTSAEQYLEISDLNFISLRLSSVYGPWSFTGPMPVFYNNIKKAEKQELFRCEMRREPNNLPSTLWVIF